MVPMALRVVMILLSLSCAFPSSAETQTLSPRNANYAIEAHLDVAARVLTASEQITWRNITSRPTSELQFHLYWNAWQKGSTYMRERALTGSANSRAHDGPLITITSMKTAEGPLSFQFVAPDDGNGDDRTVVSASLPRAIGPGEEITVELSWKADVPKTFDRTGAVGNEYFIAQWFPKIGVLEETGWNCHQFHSSTEFFSDYGVYSVRLTVPSAWVVGATGREQSRHENGNGTTTHHYYQEDVHDFAWTTSPNYVERTARFEHPTLPRVDLRLLLQPEHLGQVDRHVASAVAALKRFGEWFGPYPYGHITIVDPAWRSGADGMEYPTLFTAGTRWLIGPEVTFSTPEEVVIHEAGHQFWYGIVGTNEFEDAWMDEGITTYATGRVLAEDYPQTYYERRYFGGIVPWVFKDIRLRRETAWNRLPGYRDSPTSDALSTPAYRFDPASGRAITYGKTALWLNTLERWLGWSTVQRMLSTFFDRYRFQHPKPAQFFEVANETAGRDLGPFFDQVYRNSSAFDYGVESLHSDRTEGERYRTSLVVRRYGEATFPVDIRVTFEGGERVTESWDGLDRWRSYTYERLKRGLSVEVDPDRTLLLDINYTNNSRTLQPKANRAAVKWSLKWLVWLQDALMTWGMLI